MFRVYIHLSFQVMWKSIKLSYKQTHQTNVAHNEHYWYGSGYMLSKTDHIFKVILCSGVTIPDCFHKSNMSSLESLFFNTVNMLVFQLWFNVHVNILNKSIATFINQDKVKVILCASEHICSIVRYCFRSFKQLQKDPLHVLTDANVLVLIDTDQSILLTDAFRSR